MRKILAISSFLIGGILFAQNAKFQDNYSTAELQKIQKTIPENQKNEFYKQYLRAEIVENMKAKFKHKKYANQILKKFADTVIVGNTSNEIENTDNKTFTPSETFEQFLKKHNEYISQNENDIRMDFEKVGKILGEKDKEELVKTRIKQINEAKRKTNADLKKEYETRIYNEKENFENEPLTSRGIAKIIKQIDQNFANNLQNSEENYQLLAQNSGLYPDQRFPDVTSEPKESAIYETIPGEILTFVTENGYAAGRHYASYKIIGNNIKTINVMPYENLIFDKKISKYVKNWRFEDRTGYDITKLKSGEYLISTSLFKDEDANCCPNMAIEYKTKDFKNFVPLRISKEENKWTMIK